MREVYSSFKMTLTGLSFLYSAITRMCQLSNLRFDPLRYIHYSRIRVQKRVAQKRRAEREFGPSSRYYGPVESLRGLSAENDRETRTFPKPTYTRDEERRLPRVPNPDPLSYLLALLVRSQGGGWAARQSGHRNRP